MKKIFVIIISALISGLILAGCNEITRSEETTTVDSISDMSNIDDNSATTEEMTQEIASSEDTALAAYSALLQGDRTLLDEAQLEMWWIPDFLDEGLEYEYTYLDLDGDGVVELIVQMADDPCGYNAVFHFEDNTLFCWNSDSEEMSCRDYPLRDGTMVRQYDYNGTRSYTLFHYQSNGQMENVFDLFAREELIPEDSTEACPYYEIDGKEVDETTFNEQLDTLVTKQMLERSAWTIM